MTKLSYLTLLIALPFAAAAHAQMVQVVESHDFNNLNKGIPDNSLSGLVDTREIQSGIAEIEEIKVALRIAGNPGFVGDLYAYLTKGSEFAVLLNRAGRTLAEVFGYDDPALNVTLQDTAVNGDIHNYRLTLSGNPQVPVPPAGTLTGIWAPDGRNVHPADALDTSARTAFLESFVGTPGSGTWTLFVADVSGGGVAKLEGWGLELTGIPEPGEATVITALVLGLLCVWRAHSGRERRSKLTRDRVGG